MRRTIVLGLATLMLIVILLVLMEGCTNPIGTTEYLVVKKLNDNYIRAVSVRGKVVEFYVGSEWSRTKVGKTFMGPDVAGKSPTWINGKAVWLKESGL